MKAILRLAIIALALPAAPLAQAATAITIANFAATDGRVVQRDAGATSKNLSLSGTYTGAAPTTVTCEADIVGGGIAAGPTSCTNLMASGGAWTATFPSVPDGSFYKVKVTDADSMATATQTKNFCVGIDIALIGSSTYAKSVTTTGGASATDTYSQWWNSASGWQNLNTTNGIAMLGKQVRAGIAGTEPTTCIGILPFAIGGTDPSNWQTGGTSWTSFVDGTTGVAQPDIGGDFEFTLVYIGNWEDSAGKQTVIPADFANMSSQLRTLTGRSTSTLHIGWVELHTGVTNNWLALPTASELKEAFVQASAAGGFVAGNFRDSIPLVGDDLHTTAAGYQRLARRNAQAILQQLGLQTYGAGGPQGANAFWVKGYPILHIPITQVSGGTSLVDGAGGTSGAGLTGFVVTVAGSPATISSTSFVGNEVDLTLSSTPNDGDAVTWDYAVGGDPYVWGTPSSATDAHVVYDNQSALIGDTIGFAMMPGFGPKTATELVAAGGNWLR